MTVKELAEKCSFTPVNMPDPDRQVSGAYICDLLSWVIGRAESDNVWLTIMSNINVVAVASLADVSCVILTEGVTLDADALAKAETAGVNILSADLPTYEAAMKINSFV